ncbi:MAG: hypothetical protein KKA73_19540 [Chloroflexi bacterium]|nr:hypothetical protein [Chloroflexota bacterium]MBU1749881.1 hypothetical protein [Chloroflexota bacterium]MBU1879741.1 hypothetical protein [Chloroflexota bacterium]
MKKRGYEAPLARDLSALNVSGQEPLHTCYAGLVANEPPGTDCGNGALAVASCSPTGMFFTGTTPCAGGGIPSTNECATGGSAIVASCTSGNTN